MDCTPDVSHEEQLSIIIRFVDMDSNNEITDVEINEYFMDFINIQSTTGLNLSDILISKLKEYQIDLADCRGQGYDNGANMVGQYSGVQARILNQNPRALFMPCAAHRLNLVLGDTAKSSTIAANFFGTVERLYTLFSASTGRWNIFTSHCHRWTVKRWSETRWESRSNSIKAIRFQLKEIIVALDEIADTSKDCLITSETHSLINEISSFEFLISLCVWHTVLQEINIVSKSLQSPMMNLDISTSLLNGLLVFLEEYRKNGFETAKSEANILAESLSIDAIFKQSRIRKKKKMFDYEANDNPIQDPEYNFKCSYFLVVIDGAIESVTKRFQQTIKFNELFGFLYRIGKLRHVPQTEILKHCMDLVLCLTVNEESDICSDELYQELIICRNIVDESATPIEVLSFLKKTCGGFPNVCIALRILLTIPITSAGAERSFSKLKLIKNYLRNSMSQQRLTGLATLSIEKDLSEKINYETIIQNFAAQKSRKINFI